MKILIQSANRVKSDSFRSKLSAVGQDMGVEKKAKLKFYANSSMVGAELIVIYNIGMECKSYHYSSEHEPNIDPFINYFTSYEHPDGNTSTLNQALVIIDEERSLICIFQIRYNGLIVKDFLSEFEMEWRRSKRSFLYPPKWY